MLNVPGLPEDHQRDIGIRQLIELFDREVPLFGPNEKPEGLIDASITSPTKVEEEAAPVPE